MAYYNQLENLTYNATLAKYNQLSIMQEEFKLARRAFNIDLLEYIQNEFANDIQITDCLDSVSFSIRVTSSYWSEYRQNKLDKLQETLKGLVKTLEVIPEFIPEFTNEDGTTIFKVMVSHQY